jgi:hypothetical protein
VTETNVFQLSQPGSFIDPLTEVLRAARIEFSGKPDHNNAACNFRAIAFSH